MAKDANSARPDAVVSSHVKVARMPPRIVAIHVRHVTDLPALPALSRRARVPSQESTQESRAIQTEQENPEEQSGSLGESSLNWPLEPLGSVLTSGNFDDFIRFTEHQLSQASQQSDTPSTNHSSDGPVSRKLHILFVQGNISPRGVLEALDENFWVRVLRIYDEEVGMMYPFLDIDRLSHQMLQRKRGFFLEDSPSSSLYGEQIEIIAFLVLAIVSSFEGSKAVEITNPLVEKAFISTIPKIYLGSPSLSDLTLLILICIFFFLNDREKEAWRIVGSILRLVHEQSCQEEDISVKSIPDTFFWSLYTLDRRWSFGTGLPFALQDSEIIRQPLATHDSSLSLAYLKEMVSFCRIASDVRSYFLTTLSSSLHDAGSTQEYLQFRVNQWQQNLPLRLRFNSVYDKLNVTIEKRGDYKLRLMLYLRANQMQTIILRKAASRFGSSNIDTSNFEIMIRVARDSIQVLAGLARETDIYHAQHKTFNHFLETALSSLLLVTCYASPEQSKSCLEDVVTATQLIHRLARESLITRRLRDKLKSIRKATDDLRSKRCTDDMTEKHDSTVAGDSLQPVPSTGTPRADQDFSFLEEDANPLAGHMTNSIGDPALPNGTGTANIPIGLFDLDTVDATWADTDPSLFTNLSQILGSCEDFSFF
ncbi:hypothetical protein KAF25_004176 [Fusarium avenaceum]|uniref:Xylanolytic transcriptional activator regulatory domain-containing protein n=1 Tax=Fusarium avenaceum TaxID=40199 RepID=A0A9P7H332_9HYPO|nr:hypothetical protein KAF25_004176 [Fusarium avenaceum]